MGAEAGMEISEWIQRHTQIKQEEADEYAQFFILQGVVYAEDLQEFTDFDEAIADDIESIIHRRQIKNALAKLQGGAPENTGNDEDKEDVEVSKSLPAADKRESEDDEDD